MFCAARHDGLYVESHVQRGRHCRVWFCFICFAVCFLRLWVSGQGGRIQPECELPQVFDFMAGLRFYPPLMDTIMPTGN